jgi:hypothetical protein
MKIRVRDQKLPLKAKTKKFRPLRFKYSIMKWLVIGLFLLNLIQLGVLCYKIY